ncbi:FadR family transcriptional regulator [Xanthobacter autotrophicus]|uniref:FadR/GntR family transcriptional regulator n=1 Tax=Xanthobacter TaxID=279 RepID=UPI0024AC5D93|nr:FadR/GntR family transcriptional regulator [Xanthobacter autotrophicus]MDI4663470.1 FadR family transcriptional regulator [Xanthobacter autotrophicus]
MARKTGPSSPEIVPAAPTRRAGRGQTLGDRIYDDILQLILTSQIPEGGRLPTEAQFCEMFQVSRTVVRDALSRLKIDGVVGSRQGQGSVVLRRPNAGMFAFPLVGSIADMQRFFEFRQLIEPEVAALAAVRRTHEDLARIRAAFQAVGDALVRDEGGVEADLQFHLAIAAAAHNKYLVSSMESARGNFAQCIQFARALSTKPDERRGERLQSEHRRILDSIESGDPSAARAAMALHLSRTRDRVFLGS